MLAINDDPVTIKSIEWGIIERGVPRGLGRPKPPATRSPGRVGVVGSGPAGLAAAEELNALGHTRRRLRARRGPGRADPARRAGLQAREVDHRPPGRAARAGRDRVRLRRRGRRRLAVDELRARHDAVVLATGARIERGIDLPGNDLAGIHTAMSYLVQRNRAVAGLAPPDDHRGGQARRRDRRRRHRRGLRGLRAPRGRRLGHAARHLPAAGGQEVPRARAVAGLPEAPVVDLRARRGRQALLLVQRDRVHRQRPRGRA